MKAVVMDSCGTPDVLELRDPARPCLRPSSLFSGRAHSIVEADLQVRLASIAADRLRQDLALK
jgi:hypothetical protein